MTIFLSIFMIAVWSWREIRAQAFCCSYPDKFNVCSVFPTYLCFMGAVVDWLSSYCLLWLSVTFWFSGRVFKYGLSISSLDLFLVGSPDSMTPLPHWVSPHLQNFQGIPVASWHRTFPFCLSSTHVARQTCSNAQARPQTCAVTTKSNG